MLTYKGNAKIIHNTFANDVKCESIHISHLESQSKLDQYKIIINLYK